MECGAYVCDGGHRLGVMNKVSGDENEFPVLIVEGGTAVWMTGLRPLSPRLWKFVRRRCKVLAMKPIVITMALLFGVGSAAGQDAHSSNTSEGHFRWSSRKAQELGIENTISRSNALTDSERAALIKAIATQLRPAMADLEIGTESEILAVAAQTRIKLVDLNNDEIPEIIAQPVGLKAGCGATGNCPFWVFAKHNGGYILLLDSGNDGGFQVFTVEPTRTHGFNDLVLGSHDSASERTLFVYRYREGKYHKQPECYSAQWWCWECRPPHSLREPMIVKLKSSQCR